MTFATKGFSSKRQLTEPRLTRPAAVFPGGIAGDINLAVAANQLQTTLAATMAIGDLSMIVADPSSIVAGMLFSIDAEIVQASSAPAGSSVPVSRGFDGTAPATHLTGAAVSGLIDAWHHNALVAEIEAIEQTLGAHLSNIPATSVVTTTPYNFPAQTPGGSLSPGTNSITLSPVPQGVNGTDQHHWLYISGGAGAAEAVLITGGTAVAGAASGTVFVTCANSHSGAWTIQTATAGIREAIIAGGNYARIYIPSGPHTIYATVWSEFGASIHGAGSYQTFITPGFQNIDAFHLLGSGGIAGEFGDMRIVYAASSVSACQHGSALILDTLYSQPVANLEISGFDNGVDIVNGSSPFLENVDIRLAGVRGIALNPAGAGQTGMTANNVTIVGWGAGAGSTIGISMQGTVGGSLLSNILINQMPYGWTMVPGSGGVINEIQATNVQFDAIGVVSLWLRGQRTGTGASGGGVSHIYSNIRIASVTAASTGVIIESAWGAIRLNGIWVNVVAQGIHLRGPRNVSIIDANVIQNNGTQTTPALDIVADSDGSAASNIYISNSQIGKDQFGGTSNSYQYGIVVDPAAHGNITISNSDVYGSGNAVVLNGTGGAGVLYRFQGNTFSGGANTISTGGSAVAQFINNNGADLAAGTVSSIASNTITLTPTHENTVLVSADGSGGAATVTAPNGTQWTGRSVRIVATHANGIVFNTSGNIRAAKTLTTGQSAWLTWDGTKWDIN
jgi:hypothetical protein